MNHTIAQRVGCAFAEVGLGQVTFTAPAMRSGGATVLSLSIPSGCYFTEVEEKLSPVAEALGIPAECLNLARGLRPRDVKLTIHDETPVGSR